MFILKAVTVIVAGVLTALAVRHVMREVEVAKARVKVRPTRGPRTVTRLRQDPRTGVYYPAD